MAKEVFHNTLLTQSSLSDETVNLIDVCNSISLLTNCSTILYDFLNHNIEYVNISNAVNLKIKNMAQSKYECLNLLGDEGMDHLHRSCFHKNNFMKQLNDEDKRKMVVYGSLHISSEKAIVGGLDISFQGNTIKFTKEGDIHYEFFKLYTCNCDKKELKIFNGVTGECWQHSALSNRWMKMPILQFSAFEKQVISLSIIGMSSKQIAAKINRPEISVKNPKSRIMQAVNATNMTEASFILSHLKFL